MSPQGMHSNGCCPDMHSCRVLSSTPLPTHCMLQELPDEEAAEQDPTPGLAQPEPIPSLQARQLLMNARRIWCGTQQRSLLRRRRCWQRRRLSSPRTRLQA